MPNPADPIQASGLNVQTSGLNVSSRLIRLEQGLFGLSLTPGLPDDGSGLPGVRVCVPPGGKGRRDTIGFSTMRGDGWLGVADEPALIRVARGGGDVLVTLYWTASDGFASPPSLTLVRLNQDPALPRPGDTQAGAQSFPGAYGLPGAQGGAQRGGQLAAQRGGQLGVQVGPQLGAQWGIHAGQTIAEVVAHIQDFGDVEGVLGEWVGRRGSGRWIEGFQLTPRDDLAPEDLECRAVLGRDWLSPWVPGGRFCGSRGLALPLRGFCLRLRTPAAARYELAYAARFIDGAEAGPVGPDRVCAAQSLAALEAFQVILRPRVG